jgi:hypothetical protein
LLSQGSGFMFGVAGLQCRLLGQKATERARQDVLARSPLIQADPFADHRVALDRDDQRQVHSHAIGNDGADDRQVQLGRQEVDVVVKPVEDLSQADGLANRAGG